MTKPIREVVTMKNRMVRTLTVMIITSLVLVSMTVTAYAQPNNSNTSGGEVRLSTEVNGQFVELYFPAGSEGAIAYNRDVKPLLPNGIGRMSDAAIAAMEAWKNKYASSSQTPSGQTTPQAVVPPPQLPTLTAEDLKAHTDTMFALVNQEREKAGLAPLMRNNMLDEAAMIRAAEIRVVDLAGGAPHTRPDGTSYRTLLDDMGIKGNRCGENMSRARLSPQIAIDSLMQSDGHRRNILRENYGSIGIGVYQRADGLLDFIQIFMLK
jgi:uncharacterized protein YkwD